MSVDLEELRKQFPLCDFTKSDVCFDDFYIRFKLHGLFFRSLNNYFSLDNFIHVYNTIDYVMSFLYSFDCEVKYNIVELCDKVKIYIGQKYHIDVDGDIKDVTADELIEIVKKELSIETSYKPVLYNNGY